MYSGLFPLLFTPNFISILIWFIVIFFLVPHRPLFGLYLWLFLAFWTLFYFPISRPYVNRGIGDSFGEAVLYLVTFPIAISILVWTIFIIVNILKSDKPTLKGTPSDNDMALYHKGTMCEARKARCHAASSFRTLRHLKEQEKPPELILLNKIVLFMYGILLGVWTFLFFTDFLKRYHPAWEAYIIVVLFSFLFPLLLTLLTKNIKAKKYIHNRQIFWFIHSFVIAIISLLIYSFSFASNAMIQTKKTIEKYKDVDTKYCIQYMKIDTWLDLTPLTTWNKPSGIWGAGNNHAVLVVKTPNSPAYLYNWSYKSKTWEYIIKGFEPGAFASPSYLECTLEKDFIARVSFIIPQTNSFYIGEQKIKISPEYFPQQEKYSFSNIVGDRENQKNIHAIKFLASIPNFSNIKQIFAKLPDRYNFSTNVNISPIIDQQYLEKIFYISPSQKNKLINSQYQLNKRVLQHKSPHLNYQREIVYYQKEDNVITTAIRCYPDLPVKLKCLHYFIYDGLLFSFKHREKDLENWHILQNKLIDKIEHWQ